MEAPIVRGRTVVDEATRTITVQLWHLLTPKQPMTYGLRDYLLDRFNPVTFVPDYGDMLAQQLRRIDGITRVVITPYGCVVNVHVTCNLQSIELSVRSYVDYTLRCATPWVVERHDSHHWVFHFAQALVTQQVSRLHVDHKLPNPTLLTPLGRQVITHLRNELGGPQVLFRHRLIMGITGLQCWETLDAEFDAYTSLVSGSRAFYVLWDPTHL